MVLEFEQKLKEYIDDLLLITVVKNPFIIDFNDMIKFEPDLGESFLEDPDNFLTYIHNGLSEEKLIDVRIKNIPQTLEDVSFNIKSIRKDRINKIIQVEGIIRQISAVRPKITTIRYECPSCGNIITSLQPRKIIEIPRFCRGCARKGKFRELSKEYIDCQKLVIEEPIETLEMNQQPLRFNVLLFKDLCSPITSKINTPGNRVKISGILREYGKFTKIGESTERELLLEANYIEPTDENLIDIKLSEEDIQKFKEFVKDENFLKKLIDSLAPDIEGYETEKEAILYHLVGGNKITELGKLMRIGAIHLMLITDPGTGKSKIAHDIEQISPKSLYIDATGTSGTGITASVVKDEFLGCYAIEAGALVLANNGTAIIDEIDKMNPDDRKALHIVLSEQIVVKHKANIHATMRAETSVIGLANPKTGRFDDYLSVSEQIDMPPSLINRFDLIFPFKDCPEESKDKKIIDSMLNLRKKKIQRVLEPSFLKKFLTYTKLNFNPELTERAEEEIRKYYLKIRGSLKSSIDTKTIPITPRQGETLIKLTQASAKLRLSNQATLEDAQNAGRIMTYFLNAVGFNPDTGTIDIEKVEGIPSESKKFKTFESILRRLSEQDKLIHINLIVEESKKANIQEHEVDDFIEKMRRKGDVIQSKAGFYQLI